MIDVQQEKSEYGLLKYCSYNVGDEIQSLAATRFLPRIDYYINRERVDQFKRERISPNKDISRERKKVKMIMNGWWMWEPKHFPPSDEIDPLLISMHFGNEIRGGCFFNPKTIKYLCENGPVGCRDTDSLTFLREQSVDAYYSGCLTSTLLPSETIRRKKTCEYIVCVDIPKEIVEYVKETTHHEVYCVSSMITRMLPTLGRFEMAKLLLYIYHNANTVITTRLHAALPSVSFGVPTIMVINNKLNNLNRLSGLEKCFNLCNIENAKQYIDNHPVDKLKENPDEYLRIREKLVKTCIDFTGYDSEKSIFSENYNPIISMAKVLEQGNGNIDLLCSELIPQRNLVRAFVNRIIFRKDPNGNGYDINLGEIMDFH